MGAIITKIRTRVGLVGSANATSALCRCPRFLISHSTGLYTKSFSHKVQIFSSMLCHPREKCTFCFICLQKLIFFKLRRICNLESFIRNHDRTKPRNVYFRLLCFRWTVVHGKNKSIISSFTQASLKDQLYRYFLLAKGGAWIQGNLATFSATWMKF